MDTPEYSLLDIYRFLKGTLLSSATLGKAMLTDPTIQPNALPVSFEVPVFFISGKRDHFTPADPAGRYLESISSPDKRHVIFNEIGHYPNEDDPQRFISTLSNLVGPYLQESVSSALGRQNEIRL
jgi:pimeloyl-ACP methyl ester carboxylesterase